MTYETLQQDWQLLNLTSSSNLTDARKQLHHALQIPAAVARNYVPAEPNDGHNSFEWHDGLAALITKTTKDEYRAGLRLRDLSLLFLTASAKPISTQTLIGKSAEQGYTWLSKAMNSFVGNEKNTLMTPNYPLPEHAVEQNDCFTHCEQYADIAACYANTHKLLEFLRVKYEGLRSVRCWPQDAALSTVFVLGDTGQSVVLGMCPGDAMFSTPYWFVRPEARFASVTGSLESGRWFDGSWFGAVLTADALYQESAAQQSKQVMLFYESAFRTCQQNLTGSH